MSTVVRHPGRVTVPKVTMGGSKEMVPTGRGGRECAQPSTSDGFRGFSMKPTDLGEMGPPVCRLRRKCSCRVLVTDYLSPHPSPWFLGRKWGTTLLGTMLRTRSRRVPTPTLHWGRLWWRNEPAWGVGGLREEDSRQGLINVRVLRCRVQDEDPFGLGVVTGFNTFQKYKMSFLLVTTKTP